MSVRDTVMIVGSGMMGSGIAAVSALAGNRTVLVDQDDNRAQAGVNNAIARMEEMRAFELITDAQLQSGKQCLGWDADIRHAADQAFFVIEAIFENLAAKQDLFCTLDEMLPADIAIASNTSGLRITDIAAKTAHPARTMTTHFWFPAHLVPLVEVVMSEFTDLAMAQAVCDRLKSWGKAAVLVRRDLPGQLANRILQAIIRESVYIVQSGLATAEDVDTAIKMGMGIRFPAWGPLEHIDAVGLDLAESVQNTVLPNLTAADKAGDILAQKVADGNLGFKTGCGFYDWTVKDMEQLQKERDEFIVHALKKIRPRF